MWRNVDILQAIAFKNSTQGGSKERENQHLTCERILREREREREETPKKHTEKEIMETVRARWEIIAVRAQRARQSR